MKTDGHGGEGFKQRAIRELKLYWIITVYLWVVLGSFTIYRRLVLAQVGASYLEYGIALIEALIIAKVVLVGQFFTFSRRFEDRPLIVSVLYKSGVFGLLVLAFGVVEHLIKGWIHRKGLLGGLHTIGELGAYELAARVLMLMAAFVPLFAFAELARILTAERLTKLFFSKRAVTGQPD